MHHKRLLVAVILIGVVCIPASFVFAQTSEPIPIGNTSPFADVQPGAAFYDDILWLYGQGVTSGSAQADGTITFSPASPLTREAMAAFLYRSASSPSYTPPAVSPFSDVATTSPFYKEIAWLYANGITTSLQFYPTSEVTREVAAAFIYRWSGSPSYTPPAVSPFSDVATNAPFYREIAWIYSKGITTGTLQADGSRLFSPSALVTREAIAAFLHRSSKV